VAEREGFGQALSTQRLQTEYISLIVNNIAYVLENANNNGFLRKRRLNVPKLDRRVFSSFYSSSSGSL